MFNVCVNIDRYVLTAYAAMGRWLKYLRISKHMRDIFRIYLI